MKDLLTGEEFIPKRKSQKFASRANGIKYNNQKANELREKRAYLDKPLNKNHKILIDLMGDENKMTKTREFLKGAGFDFNVFNDTIRIDGEKKPCIYEFCITGQIGNDNIIIQKIWKTLQE